MIGFTIKVTSNIGYNPNEYTSWTEGSMWLAEKALSKFAPKESPIAMLTPDLLSGIESQFSKLKNILVTQVGGIGNMFFVGIYGSVFIFTKFDPSQPANMIVWQFLNRIGNCGVEIGDQVMIQLCKHITAFDEHITLYGTAGVPAPILTITLTL